jgi:hypothetical protein
VTRRAVAIVAGLAVLLAIAWAVRGTWIDLLPTQLQQSRTVGSYFDSPPAWPGYAWERGGATVGRNELVTSAGPSHCQMQLMTMLTIGWPPGTRSDNAAGARQYIRDPVDKLQNSYLQGNWMRNPPRPLDLADSGYRYGVLKLYIAPSDQDRYVYLITPTDSERWPRSDPMTLCM